MGNLAIRSYHACVKKVTNGGKMDYLRPQKATVGW